MVRRKSADDISGSTFADLYDAQEELSRKGVKPLGRPKNKIERKPTTIYLTKEERTMLRRLHLIMGEHISTVNRSQIMGIAIELMSELVTAHDDDDNLFEGVRNVEGIKRTLKSILMV